MLETPPNGDTDGDGAGSTGISANDLEVPLVYGDTIEHGASV